MQISWDIRSRSLISIDISHAADGTATNCITCSLCPTACPSDGRYKPTRGTGCTCCLNNRICVIRFSKKKSWIKIQFEELYVKVNTCIDDFIIMKGTLLEEKWNWKRSTKVNVTLYKRRIAHTYHMFRQKPHLKW